MCVCVCSLSLSASIPSAIIVLIPAHSVVDEDGKTGQKLLTKYYYSSSADYYPHPHVGRRSCSRLLLGFLLFRLFRLFLLFRLFRLFRLFVFFPI